MKAFILIVLVSATTLFAQVPTIQWQKCLGRSESDAMLSIRTTFDGGYIVAGVSNSKDGDIKSNFGYGDLWIIKLNSSGATEWQKSYGGSNVDVAYSIIQTTDSGYVVAGYNTSNDVNIIGNHGKSDCWILRLNRSGEIIWQKSIGGSNTEFAKSIQQTADGGYIIAGSSFSNDGDVSMNKGDMDYLIVKLSPQGDIQWQKTFGGSNRDEATEIQQTIDRGYVVVGYSKSNDGDLQYNLGSEDIWIVKLSANGNVEWQKVIGGSSVDIGTSIQQTKDGGYIIAGSTSSNNGDISGCHGLTDCLIIKLDNAGSVLWQRCIGGSLNDAASCIQVTKDNKYIISGYTSSTNGDFNTNHGNTDGWLLKLNSTGTMEWQKILGGSKDDALFALQLNPDNSIISVGSTFSNDGDVVGSNHGFEDTWIVKLSNGAVSVKENETATQFLLFPNPASQQLIIQMDISSIPTPFTIYNNLGQVVQTGLVTSAKTVIDISGISTGVYAFDGYGCKQIFTVARE